MSTNLFNFYTELSDHSGIARLVCGNCQKVVRVDTIDHKYGEDPVARCTLMADASDPLTCKKSSLEITRVIFNPPATIVFWADNTKTVVKCSENDTYSKEIGLAMAIAKKAYGNDNHFRDIFKKHIPDYMKTEKKLESSGIKRRSGRYPWGSENHKKPYIDTHVIVAQYLRKFPHRIGHVTSVGRSTTLDNTARIVFDDQCVAMYTYVSEDKK